MLTRSRNSSHSATIRAEPARIETCPEECRLPCTNKLARSGDGALLFHYPEYDSLPAGDRAAIDALVSTIRVVAGETVFRRGDPGDAMFVVKSGRFRVTGATPSGAEVTLGEIGPRDWAGEMAVLTGQPRPQP